MSGDGRAIPACASRRHRAPALLAALAAILAATLSGRADRTGAGCRTTRNAAAGERIVLTDDLAGYDDLFVLDPATGARSSLTHGSKANEAQADWSPDGTRLAYASDAEGLWRIWVLDPSEDTAVAITSGPEDLEPDWSPSGDGLLFTAHFNRGTADQASFLMWTDADGTTVRPLLALMDPDRTITGPRWSPDGQRIVFCVGGPGHGSELYVVSAEGAGARRLMAHPGWEDLDPAWSPDGTHIAFSSGRPSPGAAEIRHDIWLLDFDQGHAGTIHVDPGRDLRRPSWSPDGTTLAIDARPAGAKSPSSLHLVPLVGGSSGHGLGGGRDADWSAGPTPATPTDDASTPTASPDRTTIPGPATGTPPPITDLPPPPTLPPFPTFGPPEPTSSLAPPTYPAASATPSFHDHAVWLPVVRKPTATETGQR